MSTKILVPYCLLITVLLITASRAQAQPQGNIPRVAFLLAPCSLVQAQQAKRVYRIGYISSRDRIGDASRSAAILQRLRELGYVEGQNIAVEYRYGNSKRERFSELAAELIRLKVDIIVAVGGDALVRPIVDATKTIPIVMTGGGADPVAAGFVQSLARPGGNVTGITQLVIDTSGKRLELFKEAVPKLSRVGAIYDSTTVTSANEVKDLTGGAERLRLTLQNWPVKTVADLDKMFAAMPKQRPDGLYISPSALVNTHQKRIAEFALTRKFPTVFGRSEVINQGGLMYYGADLEHSYQRVAYFIDRILKGAKPADLPVEQPTQFKFVINLKTAKQIGLVIPPNVLARADKVIR